MRCAVSMRDCIELAVKEGRLSKEKADETLALFDDLKEGLEKNKSAGGADAEAARQTYEAMARETAEKKRQKLLQIKTWRRIEGQMHGYKTSSGEEDISGALTAHLDRDDLADFSNLEARRKAVLGNLHSGMSELIMAGRRKWHGGVRNKAILNDVVRESYREDTGNSVAKELNEEWRTTSEKSRQRFNAAGGRIAKRDDWGLPQEHSSIEVGKVPYQVWRDFIAPMLDTVKMRNEKTGLPFTSKGLDEALSEVYATIRTEGLNKVTPGKVSGQRMLANRRMDHRFLVFKDADSWLKYNERFGKSDVYSVMMGHLDHMARDIASLEILGPNPTATLRFMEDNARKWGVDAGKLDRANSQIKLGRDMWGIYTGSTNAPVHGKFARGMSGTRQVLQSAHLGSAAISSITDLNTGRIARKMAGLPQGKMIPQMLKLLNPLNKADRMIAIRGHLIAENYCTLALGQQRYLGNLDIGGFSSRLADVVLRVSGLSPWTQAGRWAFGMEFMGLLADVSGKAFDGLPKALQKTMKRYGIEAAEWDVIRANQLYDNKGTKFLRPEEIDSEDHAIALLEMIQTETEFAVPSSSLRGRAQLVSDTRPGTLHGEMMRSMAMYKSFSVTLYHTHLKRGLQTQGALSKAGYFSGLFISMTLMGAFTLQLKQIAQGKDPLPMDNASFWGRAAAQGSGLGIFGDFLVSVASRAGGNLEQTLAGPVVGLIKDVGLLTIGNIAKLLKGEKTRFGADVMNILRRNTPGGTIWYMRLAFERLVLDNIQEMIDPDALDRFRRKERRLRNEQGTRYWWRPGKSAPERLPDLENIGG